MLGLPGAEVNENLSRLTFLFQKPRDKKPRAFDQVELMLEQQRSAFNNPAIS